MKTKKIAMSIICCLKAPILTNALAGSRVKRGLFKDKKLNIAINADLNGAVNIAKIGLQNNLPSICKYLFKLCNPIKLKSDRELVCLTFTNTDSDKTSTRV